MMPRDIPLPLPAPAWFLEAILVGSFLLHILFVNLMAGGVLLVFVHQVRGLRRPAHDRLARAIAQTITVNKSLAVVLGVGPLLTMGVLYTVPFYTANILTGTAWMLVAPLIAVTFLLLYLHKYSWDRLANHRRLHVALGGLNATLFLFIPLVFLANANLALFPDSWGEVRGFFSSLWLPNVWPRYFHFVAASLALTGLFCVYRFGRAGAPAEGFGDGLDKQALRREHYGVAFFVSGLQMLVGPLVLLTLPPEGITGAMLLMLLGGVLFALPAMGLMWREIERPAAELGARFPLICILLTTTVLFMGTARHFYREAALRPHRERLATRTARHRTLARDAYREMRRAGASPAGEAKAASTSVEHRFKLFCGACHAPEQKLVGPPLREIAQLYAGNPDGIVVWAKAPGKKRADYPQMPAFGGLVSEADLSAIARFMLQQGELRAP